MRREVCVTPVRRTKDTEALKRELFHNYYLYYALLQSPSRVYEMFRGWEGSSTKNYARMGNAGNGRSGEGSKGCREHRDHTTKGSSISSLVAYTD